MNVEMTVLLGTEMKDDVFSSQPLGSSWQGQCSSGQGEAGTRVTLFL